MSHAIESKLKSGTSRRDFLRDILVASTVPAIVPASVLGRGGVAPSNRIALGYIGVGSRGMGLADEFARMSDVESVAACDVWKPFRDEAQRRFELRPEDLYIDFRELLDRTDIDAVAIASPDHWHVPMAIAAMKSGKDVYCEKPLSNTICEGRALVDAASRYARVFQHGTFMHSRGDVRHACELVINGRIGELKEILVGSPPGKSIAPQAPQPVPEGLDYDLWIGPAPMRPYTHHRVFDFGWYFISDYSKSGWLAGFGVHDIDIAQLGMGLERSGPISIEGQAEYPDNGLFDTPMTYTVEFKYANGVKMNMTDTGRHRHGVTFIGEDGWIFTRGNNQAEPLSLLRESIRPDEVHLPRSPGHVRNFLDCVKSRAEAINPAEIAHRATSTALLAGIACNLGRKLNWDPENEIFVGDERANGFLKCAMRSPWQVV